jgi:hypothetical protein
MTLGSGAAGCALHRRDRVVGAEHRPVRSFEQERR